MFHLFVGPGRAGAKGEKRARPRPLGAQAGQPKHLPDFALILPSPLDGRDDGHDGPPGIGRQRRPGADNFGKVGVDLFAGCA
jgi:hypothetical protein